MKCVINEIKLIVAAILEAVLTLFAEMFEFERSIHSHMFGV